MGGKSSTPSVDPAIAEQNRIERERAEADRLKATQDQLGLETQQQNARFGKRSLLSSAGQVGFSRSLLGG